MSVSESDTIVLVPGLLGFGSFGPEGEPPRLSYFRHVCEGLADLFTVEWRLPAPPRFHVHEPPPTGPLAERMASLWLTIDRLLTLDARPGSRVHVIGHSTGGLDARLLVNPRYTPTAGPTRAEKQRMVSRLGSVVSLSAPHRGAPIASRLEPLVPHLIRGPVSGLIGWLYLVSILNTAGSRALIGHARRLLTSLLALPKSLVMPVAASRELLQLTTGLDPVTADQIGRFLRRVVEDNRLIVDLTPAAMQELNQEIAEGDTFPIHSFVSVSPRPRLWPPVLTRALYAAVYEQARPRHDGEDFPQGEWIGEAWPELATRLASDGVVTSASQPSPAAADAARPVQLIAADHLDVVGHFEGVGETFFDSGANMTRQRFYELWRRIARVL